MEISWLDEPRESPDLPLSASPLFLFRNNLDTGIAVFANGVKVPQRNSFVLLSPPLNENAPDFLAAFLSSLSLSFFFERADFVFPRKKRKEEEEERRGGYNCANRGYYRCEC